MKLLNKVLFATLSMAMLLIYNSASAQNNPVLPGVADVGVINFNGKYYLAGVSTNGGFHISSDLVNWKGPTHVLTMNNDWTKGQPFGDNQIHAADIVYRNGKFHFYWSVNYWGPKYITVHAAHAVADNILGPYIEPVKNKWFDDRIDPDLFIDSDSSHYFYIVKFTDGNTIWGQQLSDPWTHKGKPKLLFNSLPDTWERMDNNVMEGPEVIKYRSKYYMMYNGNHTGNNYGNYALGVAEADHPLGFNDGNKYSHPVIEKNLRDNPEEQRYVFTASVDNFTNWRYTTTAPAENWTTAAFNDSGWKTGDKGFGNRAAKGSTVINPQTVWDSDDIWVRKRFKMAWSPSSNLQLLVNNAGPTEVTLDGNVIYKASTGNYTTVDLDVKTIESLKTGEHILAIYSKRTGRGANVDVDLLDPLNKKGGDIIYNPGQPTFVKGPNGFEWWVVYFGIRNGERRGQFVNRVLFNDHELTVDGMTSDKTPGYHPDPALPVFGDIFEDAGSKNLADKWLLRSGKWSLKDGELLQRNAIGKSVALIKSRSATNYLFKTGVKPVGAANAGIIAYYDGPLNYLEIGLNKTKNAWYSRSVQAGRETITLNKLSSVFNFNVYHSLSVYKNGKRVEVMIDDQAAPGNSKINTSFTKPGISGLFTMATKASFDGVIYTPGWDEYNATITGWGNAADGQKATGKWKTNEKGISFHDAQNAFAVFKGDRLNEYEFGTQVYFDTNDKLGMVGIYPVYTDQGNYLKTFVDIKNNKLVISGKLNGEAVSEVAVPLKRTLVNYPNIAYRDVLSKVYTLKSDTELSGLQIVKSVHNKRDMAMNLFDTLRIEYSHHNEWHPLKVKISPTDIQAIDKAKFEKITADAIRLTKPGGDPNVPVYKLYTDEEKTSDYNIRAVKLKDKVMIFLDGKQVAEVKGAWPASQVGLFGSNARVSYNGILMYEK